MGVFFSHYDSIVPASRKHCSSITIALFQYHKSDDLGTRKPCSADMRHSIGDAKKKG